MSAIRRSRSANIPSESLSSGQIPAKIEKATPYKTSNHPNKKKIGATNDFAGGIAALGGITALVGLMALLMPMHLLTSAITFLTSITTFFTNVNNAVSTYLTIVDALLGIVGVKGSAKKMKAFIASILDNAFGKDNAQELKNAFAKGVNNIAVTTKLLEKVEQMRNQTDDKVDAARFAVGTINNALAEQGYIPAEMMETSKAIDKFIGDSKNAEELEENIDVLTKEIRDKDETNKILKEEQEARDKKATQIKKDVDSVANLLDTAKTDVSKLDITNL
jgi:Flp pilus assembly pilin Flp